MSVCKFSIIIPAYNVSKYLIKCLDSIFDQADEENLIEVILVNDGSKDNFIEVVEKYFSAECSGEFNSFLHKSNKVIVINQENAGVSNSRNRGIDVATGEYCLFVDPDDYVLPGYYKNLVSALNDSPSDLLILGYIRECEDADGKVVRQSEIFPMSEYDYNNNCEIVENLFPLYFGISVNDLKNGNGGYFPKKEHGGVWRVCYRREFLNSNGIRFDDNIKVNEDGIFNSKCLVYADSVKSINKAYYKYIIRTTGTFKNRNVRNMLNNKLFLLIARGSLVEELKESGHNNAGLELYAGSNVLSLIELMNNSSLKYKDILIYYKKEEVKRSVKLVPYIKNLKFDVCLLFLKCHMPRVLFLIVRFLKRLGVKVN